MTRDDRPMPYPDHPLFNWDFQWHPPASPGAGLTTYRLNPAEKRKLEERKRRGFGFAQALRP